REALAEVLKDLTDVEVIAVCSDLESLREVVEAERPDLVLTDIRMPPGHSDEGIRLASELRSSHPEIGVVILSQYAESSYAPALLDRADGIGRSNCSAEILRSGAEHTCSHYSRRRRRVGLSGPLCGVWKEGEILKHESEVRRVALVVAVDDQECFRAVLRRVIDATR